MLSCVEGREGGEGGGRERERERERGGNIAETIKYKL